jgi:hypothetical protein
MMNLGLNTIHTCNAGLSALLPTLLGPVALLASSPSASASTMVYARAVSTVEGGDSVAQSAPSGSVADVYIGDADTGAAATGRTAASFGVLHAFGTTSMTSAGSFASRFTTSTAAFQDDFLIDAPGLTGTAGTVRVRFTIDGSLSAVGNGTPVSNESALLNSTWAQAEYGFGVGIGLSTTTKSQRLYGDGRQTGTPFLGIEQEVVLGFTYGTLLTDVTLRIGALNSAAAQFTNYTSQTTADLEHTATWGGFAEVRDANGDLVTNYTFSSTSGTNYVTAVPEPGTISLFLAGSCALGFARRRPSGRA